MRIYKILFTGIIITVLSIGYVHQRVEIIKTGYSLQKSRKYLSYLVDQNSKLMYNLSKLESPRNLLTSMDGEEIEFACSRTPGSDRYQVARVDAGDGGAGDSFIGKFLDLFTVNAEAKPRK